MDNERTLMGRESGRVVRSSTATSWRRSLGVCLALALLWVPATVRVSQPLLAAHAVGGMSKISKSAVLPHDPVTPLPFVAAARTPVPAPVQSFRVVDLVDRPRLIDHSREAVGLRAPPVPVL